jgi:hypothetical protein
VRFRWRGRTAAAGSPVDPATADLLRLTAVWQVAARAVELRDRADEVITSCSLPGETPGAVARRGCVVAGEYGRLSGWADDLAAGSAADSVPGRVAGLVRYHLVMVDLALKLAFPRYRTEKSERLRMGLSGLGEPAEALREVEVVLRRRIEELNGA